MLNEIAILSSLHESFVAHECSVLKTPFTLNVTVLQASVKPVLHLVTAAGWFKAGL